MRFYLKIFAMAFLCFAVVIGTGLYFFMKPTDATSASDDKDDIFSIFDSKKDEITPEDRLSLEKMTEKSNRVNVLMMGNDGGRSDTMMIVSYDPETKLIDIISVPRDTYYQLPGKSPIKLNAVFGMKGTQGGPAGTAREISKLLGIPIHNYVSVDYKAVEEVVDILGGIEIDIPRRMKYDDPYDKPPLHIDLKAGKQTLNGKQAIQFLRWRKNNDGSGGEEGDLGRIERQQMFVKTAIKKALGLKLPMLIPTAFKYVKTDMNAGDMLKQGTSMIGMDMKSIRSYRIPGEARNVNTASYYLHYPKATEAVMLAIYNRTGSEPPVDGTLTKLEEVIDPSIVIKDSKKTVVVPTEEKKVEKPKEVEEEPVVEDEPADVEEPVDPEAPSDFPESDIIPDDFVDNPPMEDDTSLEDIQGEPDTSFNEEPIPEAPPVQ